MTNITASTAPKRIRVINRTHARMVIAREQADGRHVATYHAGEVSVSKAPQRRVSPTVVYRYGFAVVLAACCAIYAGSSHADELTPGCDTAAPVVVAKHHAMSYAPHHHSGHSRLPAALRTPDVGCTRKSLGAVVAPVVLPAAEDATAPIVADVAPVIAETPSGAIAAAGAPSLAAVPIAILVAGVAVCIVAGPCDRHSSTTGGHSNSTTGTTGTVSK